MSPIKKNRIKKFLHPLEKVPEKNTKPQIPALAVEMKTREARHHPKRTTGPGLVNQVKSCQIILTKEDSSRTTERGKELDHRWKAGCATKSRGD